MSKVYPFTMDCVYFGENGVFFQGEIMQSLKYRGRMGPRFIIN